MTRQIFGALLFFLVAQSGAGMSGAAPRAFEMLSSRLLSIPLSKNLRLAEIALQSANLQKNPILQYRLALCMRALNRPDSEVLTAARKAAETSNDGIAKYFYGILLEEKKSTLAKEWFDAAGKDGIDWPAYIRSEQEHLTGCNPSRESDFNWEDYFREHMPEEEEEEQGI